MPVGKKLGRDSSHRNSMFRNMVTSLFKEERIETTGPKAREVKRLADKMVTLAKRSDLHARRQAMEFLLDETVTKKLFDEIAPKYVSVQGGYTRVIKLGNRRGDAAEMVVLELV